MTPDGKSRFQKDLEFIKQPQIWPMWPALPMKKPPHEVAFLFGDPPNNGEGPITLHLGNIWKSALAETKEYESIEAMLRDGWVVD